MLSGEFERKLRKLNKNLRIFCGNDDSKPAGIFTVVRGEYTEICGIDKNYIPEYAQKDEIGRIRKSGFRRALKILIEKGYIDRKETEKEFSLSFEYKVPKFKYSSPSLRSRLLEKGISVVEEQSGYNIRSRVLS